MTWQDDAACRTVPDGYTRAEWVDVFFAPKERFDLRKIAAAVCAGCPVRDECREFATANDEIGWWGASGKQRKQDRRRRSLDDIGNSTHGTPGGYQAHRWRKQEPCDACAEAHRQACAERRARNRKPINHGIEGGYRTHYRRGETPCDACRTAHNLAVRERQERAS